jgi:hypothetical protein
MKFSSCLKLHKFVFGFVLLFAASFSLRSQNLAENIYLVKIPVTDSSNFTQITNLLSHYSSPCTISFDDDDSVYVIKTTRVLDKNIISGKLQKNFFPITSFQKIEDVFPKNKSTGNPEQDAIDYDIRKAKWIQENPEKYRLMNQSSQQH